MSSIQKKLGNGERDKQASKSERERDKDGEKGQEDEVLMWQLITPVNIWNENVKLQPRDYYIDRITANLNMRAELIRNIQAYLHIRWHIFVTCVGFRASICRYATVSSEYVEKIWKSIQSMGVFFKKVFFLNHQNYVFSRSNICLLPSSPPTNLTA